MPEMAGYLAEGKIAGHFDTTPIAITPSHVTLRRGADGSTFDVAADFVLKLVGYEQDNDLLIRCGLELQGDDHIPQFDPATMETNVEGLYVAGTAVGGTQSHYKIFLENCHVHVDRIVASLRGTRARIVEDVVMAEPES
jgi:thioredoxin reductase (NADPH)